MRARLLLGFALVLGLGCGSGKFAPVSGTVTMNGKPLAGALVIFSPIAKEGSIDAGPGSSGKTNDKGLVNQVPVRYNGKTELTYDVPAGGTDKADFALNPP